jgi:hypothetical protein
LKNKVYLVFGCHCHQPLGNFDDVIERIFQESYLPFLQTAANHPRIKIVLHYSGALLSWLNQNHPEFFDLLKHMVHKNQIELLSGSYYEAILAVIPEGDQVEQVRRLTSFIEDRFEASPKGMWLAERVWEPKLAKTLSSTGMEFSLVDDFHFKSAGLENEQLWNFFRVEEEGRYFSLFPISETLRYLTPFQEVNKSIEYLKRTLETKTNPLLVIVDDGEKFGSWPGTRKWVYEDGWLDRFFTALEENSDWIETQHCSEYMRKFPPGRLCYIPIGSYFEMGEWSLFPERAVTYRNLAAKLQEQNIWDDAKGFLKGGIWRNFLLKYPESNHMHKKMLALSQRIQLLREERKKNIEDQRRLDSASTSLFKSQGNDAYWHGIFGGLYLPHLRHEIWRYLIQAEKTLDLILHSGKAKWIESEISDIDGDGRNEIILKNPWLTACFDPSEGGIMDELDYKPMDFNLLNTLARRFEAYHQDIEAAGNKEETVQNRERPSIHDMDKSSGAGELKESLFYDRNRRASFIDRFFDRKTNLSHIKNESYTDLGDFASGEYEFNLEKNETFALLILGRNGKIEHDDFFPIRLAKKIQMMYNDGPIEIAYEITNRSGKILEAIFGVEMNFALPSGQSPEVSIHFPGAPRLTSTLTSSGDQSEIKEVQIIDNIRNFNISLHTDRPADIWWFPVETVSQSEKGYDLTYQSTVIHPRWELNIPPGACWNTSLKLSVSSPAPPGSVQLKN